MTLTQSVRAELRIPRRYSGVRTQDSLMTFDSQTIDSAGAFMISELERLDQTLHMPLVAYSWSRDMDLRSDVSMGDEISSYTNSTFAAPSGIPGSNIAWIGKDANALSNVGIDIGKTPNAVDLWGMELGWTLPELASAQQLGRPIDTQKYVGMQLKWNMDVDQLVYIGDSAKGSKGLTNHSLIASTGNAVTGGWATEILTSVPTVLADVNELLNDVWKKSGYAVCPEELRLPPKQYSLLVSTLVSSAGNMSALRFLSENSLSLSVNGKPLNIKPLKWLTGTTAGGQGPGVSGADRMVAYTKQKQYVRFPLVPMMRTPLEYRSLRQLVSYYCRLGVVEMPYGETVGWRDGI